MEARHRRQRIDPWRRRARISDCVALVVID